MVELHSCVHLYDSCDTIGVDGVIDNVTDSELLFS